MTVVQSVIGTSERKLGSKGSGSGNIPTLTVLTKAKSRSSAWLEHYTDNVGVSSSNLDGTTTTMILGD